MEISSGRIWGRFRSCRTLRAVDRKEYVANKYKKRMLIFTVHWPSSISWFIYYCFIICIYGWRRRQRRSEHQQRQCIIVAKLFKKLCKRSRWWLPDWMWAKWSSHAVQIENERKTFSVQANDDKKTCFNLFGSMLVVCSALASTSW